LHLSRNVTGSHTGSQEWQSFEFRMRQRRVERCLLKADVALEAGFLDDAREALEEARSLSPSSPELIDLERRIAAFDAVPIPAPELQQINETEPVSEIELVRVPALAPEARQRGRGMATAATALLLGGAGILSVWLRPVELRPLAPAHLIPAERVRSASAPSLTQEPSLTVATDSVTAAEIQPELEPLAIGTSSSAASAQVASLGMPAVPPGDELPRSAEDSPVPPTPAPPLPTIAQSRSEPSRDERPRAEPERTEPARAPLPTARMAVAPVTSLPTAASSGGTSVDPPPSSDSPAGVNNAPAVIRPDEQVRTVLGRYEAAYSSLDAAAAAAVYPQIDREKLARAFDALATQRVSLGACAIEVAGPAATANCDGSATWEPKVGGGSRTQPRRWRFELRLAGNNWRIVDATVR
jgi:hypothetical protein